MATVLGSGSFCYRTICFLLVGFCLMPLSIHGSDPDPLQDFCVGDLSAAPSVNGFPCKPLAQVNSSDFFFSGLAKEGNTSNQFGVIASAGNVLTFPALNTLGLSMNRVDFAPGGLNLPHSHPRATETGVVIKGTLLVGFISTSNVFYSQVLNAGEMFVVPRGLVHFQMNVGKDKALAITAFNSQLPGSAVVARALFGSKPAVPDEVLTKGFQADQSVINDIKAKFSS